MKPKAHKMKTNYWKTSDIKLSSDGKGFYNAEHVYAGLLLDWHCFASRAEARRAAVKILRERHEDDESLRA